MDIIDIVNDFNGKRDVLSKLIHSWNLIDMYSKNDFVILADKILRNLSEGQTELKIKRIIESELCVTYGLYHTEFDAEKLTNEIMTWWKNSSEVKIATDIETGIFYSIIKFLKNNNWNLTAEYDEKIFDKGIDFDFYQLCKNDETITLAWSNWFEGEIKATDKTLNEISEHFKISFTFGEPEYLQNPNIVDEIKNLLNFKK